ncbi:hypothetical protein C8R47DRAFT_468517 [Mycena vitilis]|nr:hypothetical protein C8R47DRAFT_468517 [Mycena vitilis]
MEEDIDNETLQAQIDLSMSFAQNLVSSWVKPSTKPTKNSSRVLEAELKEYMRRPARLGVGAPIPEVASSSRDTERLKSHLSGKGGKRARGDDDDGPAVKQLSDNEEESRGASIKKKARVDPFEASRKKKKKAAPPPPHSPPLPEPKGLAKEPHREPAVSDDVALTPASLSPSKRAKKKKHKNKSHPEFVVDSGPLPGPSKPRLENADSQSNESPVHKSVEASPVTEAIDISLIVSAPASPTVPAHRSQKNSLLLKGPLLNLTGPPPSDDESEGEAEPGTPSTSPKKKRRKRKKRKSSLGGQHSL